MKSTDQNSQGNSDELFEALLKNAPPRVRPPAGSEAEIRASLHTQWKQMTARRRKRRVSLGLATAASLALAVFFYGAVLENSATQMPHSIVASLARMSGPVSVGDSENASDQRQLLDGEALMSGTLLSTASGARLAMAWVGGESIRLDENTRVRLNSETELELLYGRIYIDTNSDNTAADRARELVIKTSQGRVQHLGTQYMTSLKGRNIVVSVRQGSVAIRDDNEETIARSGQQLSKSGPGHPTLKSIAIYGNDWQWAEEISPVFQSDGRTLADFLDWVSRESGRSLEFNSVMAETLAHETVMRGTIDLPPMRALNVILQTSDLVANVSTGVIMIHTQ